MQHNDQIDTAVRAKLARAVTDGDVPDHVVKSVASTLVSLSEVSPVRKFDVSTHGIVVEYIVEAGEWQTLFANLFGGGHHVVDRYEGFPYGLLADDLMRIVVEVQAENVGIG